MTPSPAERALRAQRQANLRATIAEHLLDGAIITDLHNVRYLSGFTGSNGALVVGRHRAPTLVTDSRYTEQAAAESPEFTVVRSRGLREGICGLLAHGRWGVETHALTVDAHAELADESGAELLPLGRAVEDLRVVKDDVEIAALRRACALSVAALSELIVAPLAGLTERQIARRLENLMLDGGAEAIAFETIVAAGENAAIPHHRPTDRVLARGDLLKIDFGARFDGYHADCTRTFVVGPPDAFQREIHAAVRRAQAAGVAALGEGLDLAAPWHAAQATLTEDGWVEHFTTGLGHGVGLQIHEDPYPSEHATGRIRGRTVLTIEPGIYVPGRGGVRIEDTVLVTSETTEVLTPWTTELLEIA